METIQGVIDFKVDLSSQVQSEKLQKKVIFYYVAISILYFDMKRENRLQCQMYSQRFKSA